MIKKYYDIAKAEATKWVVDGWNSDSIFQKGKVIFVGVVLFFIVWKLIYSIFN
tara:strand:- start:268 stop:426 length:159 start_codon:yes stop_codon:yes gene_type:complete